MTRSPLEDPSRRASPLRICYVAHSNSHFTAPYVDYFAARGHEIHVVSFHPHDLPNAVMHHPAGTSFDPERDKTRYVWNAGQAVRLIRSIRPHILHAHYVTSNGVLAAASGVHPLVVSARGDDVNVRMQGWFSRRLIDYVLRRADLVNPVSRDLEEKILALGCPPTRTLRLTQGIVPGAFMVDRSTRRAGPIRLICTRPLAPEYQCDRIVSALAMLAGRRDEWEFTFAATGPMEEVLKRKVERGHIRDRIVFLGGFAHETLPGRLAGADIYVSASVRDGTSPALLEAMASGAFPVVSDIPANREWLTGEGDGLLFAPHDEGQMARHLSRAIEDHALRRASIEINRSRVLERGDRDTNMEILARAYRRLLEKGGPASSAGDAI